jgi:replicative DNA helicase
MSRSDDIKKKYDLKSYIEKETGQSFNRNNKMRCPFHDDKTASFHLNDSGVSWRCHGASCAKSGSVIDFVQYTHNTDFKGAMYILDGGNYTSNGNGYTSKNGGGHVATATKPTTKRIINTTSGYRNMVEYCNSKYPGVPMRVFSKAGFEDVTRNGKPYMSMPTRDGIPRLRNLSGNGSKYQPDWTNELFKEKKQRREKKKANGEKLLPDDFIQAQWYYIEKAQTTAQRENVRHNLKRPLVLCNGQTSSVIANHYGIPAFAKTDGENPIPRWLVPELVELLADNWQLFVALDCDGDGKGHKMAQKIITQFYQYNPVFIDFGKTDGYDMADFCLEYRDNSWDMLQKFIAPLPQEMTLPENAVDDIRSGLSELARAQKEATKEPETILTVIDELEQRLEILKLGIVNNTKKLEDVTVQDVYEHYLDVRENPQPISGLRTGLTNLDYALGGIETGVYTFLGLTGAGKTTTVCSVGASLIEQEPGFIMVGEAGRAQIIRRLVAYLSGVNWKSLKTGVLRTVDDKGVTRFPQHSEEQHQKIADAFIKVRRWEKQGRFIFFDNDNGRCERNTVNLLKQVRKARIEHGVRWAIMDSADNIPSPGESDINKNIAKAMVMFDNLASELEIPVITTSQGGRNIKGRSDKRLGKYDAYGSGFVEMKSYALMTIYNHWELVRTGELVEQHGDDLTYPKDTIELCLKKLRDDEIGSKTTVQFLGGCGVYDYKRK